VGTGFAAVLTEHEYSAQLRYQAILPILPGVSGGTPHRDQVISWRNWFAAFPRPVQSVVLPIPAMFSLWHSTGIARETEYVLDEESLAEIDRRLCAYFSLPPAPGG
jgi:hypothetical protein